MDFDRELDDYLVAEPKASNFGVAKGFGVAAVAGASMFGGMDASAAVVPLFGVATASGASAGFGATMVTANPTLTRSSRFVTGVPGMFGPATAMGSFGFQVRAVGFSSASMQVQAGQFVSLMTASNFSFSGSTATINATMTPGTASLMGPLVVGFMAGTALSYSGWVGVGTGVSSMGAIQGGTITAMGPGSANMTIGTMPWFLFGAIQTNTASAIMPGAFAGGPGGGPAVPEPGTTTLALLALGALGAVEMRRRKKEKADTAA